MNFKKLTSIGVIATSLLMAVAAANAEVVNMSNGDRITGKVLRSDENTVVLDTSFGSVKLPRDQIVGISANVGESKIEQSAESQKAQAEVAADKPKSVVADNDETAPEAKEKVPEWIQDYRNFLKNNMPEGWQFRLRGGLEYRSSTSSVTSVYASFDTIKEWGGLTKFAATAYYNYTQQTSASDVRDVTLDKYGLDTSYRRDFNETKHWYFQNILNYKRDGVKGIRDQVDEAVTLGYRFDLKRYDLIIDIAPGPAVRYINAKNYDKHWVAMAVLAENLQWKISHLLRFEQNGYLGFNIEKPDQYSANLALALIVNATDVMDIALRYAYSYDSINAAQNQKTEQTLLLSFEFPFNWKY